MKTKLIVLIDFSPYTPTILKFANAWCEKSGSETLVIHQLFSPESRIQNLELPQNNIKLEKTKTLRKIGELLSGTFNEKITLKTDIITGDMIEYLRNLPDQDSNNPVLLGMKGNSTGDKPLMGKLTKAIIENLNSLTVIVPVTLKAYLPNSLTVGLSCKYPLNKPAFNKFLTRVSAFITHIRFISVMAAAKEFKRCHEYLLNLSLEYSNIFSAEFEIFEGITAFHQIKEYIAQLPETMFVVQKGEHMFADRTSQKLLINDLAYTSCIPLVVIPQ